jgi:tRNA U54 and U55 pseudouridine synthase Pus10
VKRTRLADPLREWAEKNAHPELASLADSIDLEHSCRIANCKREVRRHFARYMRSVIADYERGESMRNRNHAHRKVRLFESATGRTSCGNCGQSISHFDHFCRHCGAKLTGTDYEEEK